MHENASYRQRYIKRFKELSWSRDNILWAGVTALAVPLASYWRSGKFDKETILAILQLYVSILSLYLLIHAVRTVLRVDADGIAAYRDVAKKLAIANEQLEEGQLRSLLPPVPTIELSVKEAIIIPGPGRADCFVCLYLHNSASGAPVTIPEYRITLEIGGKTFSSAFLLSPSEFQVVNYVEDDDDMPRLVASVRNDMPDLQARITDAMPLDRGKPKEGWLAFGVTGVPEWPTHQNVLGSHVEYNEEGEEYLEDDIEIVLMTTSVATYEISIRDPYGGWHSTGKIPYQRNWYRGVIKKTKL